MKIHLHSSFFQKQVALTDWNVDDWSVVQHQQSVTNKIVYNNQKYRTTLYQPSSKKQTISSDARCPSNVTQCHHIINKYTLKYPLKLRLRLKTMINVESIFSLEHQLNHMLIWFLWSFWVMRMLFSDSERYSLFCTPWLLSSSLWYHFDHHNMECIYVEVVALSGEMLTQLARRVIVRQRWGIQQTICKRFSN